MMISHRARTYVDQIDIDSIAMRRWIISSLVSLVLRCSSSCVCVTRIDGA